MQVTITTQLDHIRAVNLFSAAQDVRYYLCGIHIETGPCGARIVGTNGHSLGALSVRGEFPTASVIVPNALIAGLKAPKRNPPDLVIEFEEGTSPANRLIKITLGDQSRLGTELDGKFPDVQRVIPAKTSGEPAHYNPEYLCDIAKAQALLGIKNGCAEIGYNGNGTALINVRDDFIALLMPVRSDSFVQEAPHWAYANLQAVDSAPLAKAA